MDTGLSLFSLCVSVYTHQADRTPALQQNWQSSEQSQNLKEKTQHLMNKNIHAYKTIDRTAFLNSYQQKLYPSSVKVICSLLY